MSNVRMIRQVCIPGGVCWILNANNANSSFKGYNIPFDDKFDQTEHSSLTFTFSPFQRFLDNCCRKCQQPPTNCSGFIYLKLVVVPEQLVQIQVVKNLWNSWQTIFTVIKYYRFQRFINHARGAKRKPSSHIPEIYQFQLQITKLCSTIWFSDLTIHH